SALRLRYAGSVNFKGRVNARMQARILRDTWGVGRILSLALWPISKAFEYKITGTVSHPQSAPVFIPKMLLWPLHPVQTFKRIFGRDQPPAPAEDEEESLFPLADPEE